MTVRANRRPKELLPENRRKLGQKAKLLLQRANLDADPNYLYPLQLAQWVLEKRKDALPGLQERNNAHDLLELANQLFDRPPKKVLKLFLSPDHQAQRLQREGEDQLLHGDLLQPEDLGVRLVENLYRNVANLSPSLDPPHELD